MLLFFAISESLQREGKYLEDVYNIYIHDNTCCKLLNIVSLYIQKTVAC